MQYSFSCCYLFSRFISIFTSHHHGTTFLQFFLSSFFSGLLSADNNHNNLMKKLPAFYDTMLIYDLTSWRKNEWFVSYFLKCIEQLWSCFFKTELSARVNLGVTVFISVKYSVGRLLSYSQYSAAASCLVFDLFSSIDSTFDWSLRRKSS